MDAPTSSSSAAPRRASTRCRSRRSPPCERSPSATTTRQPPRGRGTPTRDGFVFGEGAAVLVIETAEHAKARGAKIYGEVAGAGITADGHHIAQPDPEGKGATRAMRAALADAERHRVRRRPHQRPRQRAPRRATWPRPSPSVPRSGEAAADVAVTSTKSMTGHLLGAAGAVESLACVMALHDQLMPPTINLDNLDPEVQLDIVSGQATQDRRRSATRVRSP